MEKYPIKIYPHRGHSDSCIQEIFPFYTYFMFLAEVMKFHIKKYASFNSY